MGVRACGVSVRMALFAATVVISVRALHEWRLRMSMLDLPAADPEHTTQAAVEEGETDRDDEQSGNDAQPGVEGLRHDVAREVECHRSEGEDPGSVSQRHRQSEALRGGLFPWLQQGKLPRRSCRGLESRRAPHPRRMRSASIS